MVISLVCLSPSILDRLGKSLFGLSQDHTTEGQQVHCWYMTSPGAISYWISVFHSFNGSCMFLRSNLLAP
jgi:hypothetical protein